MLKSTLDYLKSQNLVAALWWFIENGDGLETAVRAGAFFYLRERVRMYFEGDAK